MNFFNPGGVTSTSANHLANLAKEYILSKKQFLESISFISTEIQVAGQTYKTLKSTSKEQLETIKDALDDITKATSLIAYLREAIKAKDNFSFIDFHQWLIENNKELEPPTLETFVKSPQDLPLDQYLSYINNQTAAAVLGEYIHPDGSISKARKKAEYSRNNPTTINGEGRDLMVTTNICDYTTDEINQIFFPLQKQHREVQAKFNSLDQKMNNEVELRNSALRDDYNKKLKEFRSKETAYLNEYNMAKAKAEKENKDLKIYIPECYKTIVEKLNNLG